MLPLPTPLRIAWRNLGRNRKRTGMALAAIAVGQFAFLASAALFRGYGDQFLSSITGPLIGHIQIHAPAWRDERPLDLTIPNISGTLATIRQTPLVANAAPRVYAPVLAALTTEGFMGMVVGIDPASESHADGLLGTDQWANRLGDRQVLIGRNFADQNNIAVGMEIALVGQDVDGSIANDLFTVSEIISSSVEVVNNLGIVMALEDVQDLCLMPDQAHEIVIHIEDPDLVNETLAALAVLPELQDMDIEPWQEIVPQFVTMIGIMDVFMYFILFIVFIAAAAGIANTMLMSTFERAHEFGMLLSLGCRPGRLSKMIAVEASFLGLLGVLIGTSLGIGFFLMTMDAGINYGALGGSEEAYEVGFQGLQISSHVFPRLYVWDVVSGTVAVLLTSCLAVLWPMWHIARLEPMEAMRT